MSVAGLTTSMDPQIGPPVTKSSSAVLTYRAASCIQSRAIDMPTVLVLDDEPFVRHAARDFSRDRDTVRRSRNVDRAIELLHRRRWSPQCSTCACRTDARGSTCWRASQVPNSVDSRAHRHRQHPTDEESRHREAARLRVFQARRIFHDREFSAHRDQRDAIKVGGPENRRRGARSAHHCSALCGARETQRPATLSSRTAQARRSCIRSW